MERERCRLALELGRTLEEIDATPFRDVAAWRRYFAESFRPSLRLEGMLAQLAMLIHNAHCGPGQEKPIGRFLLFDRDQDGPPEGASAIGRVLTDPAEMEAVCRVLFGGNRRNRPGEASQQKGAD